MRAGSILVSVAALAVAVGPGCKTVAIPEVTAVPLVPQTDEHIGVEYVFVLVDASGSMSSSARFKRQRALVESFVASMPDGQYEAGKIAFGGYERDVLPVAPFDRQRLREGVATMVPLEENTPLDEVLSEARRSIAGRKGRVAVVIFSDGKATAPGGWKPVPQDTIAAAQLFAEVREQEVCFFTVNTAEDAEGGELLQTIASVTDCGEYRVADQMQDIVSLHSLQRDIFIGEALPQVAAAPPGLLTDGDSDGVPDALDRCPDTPQGARVFSDGCMGNSPVYFALNSARVEPGSRPILNSVGALLTANPDMSVRIEGHADSNGPSPFNQKISEQRAQVAKAYLEEMGVEAGRITTRAWGDANPPVPNDSRRNRAANRRVEFYFTR